MVIFAWFLDYGARPPSSFGFNPNEMAEFVAISSSSPCTGEIPVSCNSRTTKDESWFTQSRMDIVPSCPSTMAGRFSNPSLGLPNKGQTFPTKHPSGSTIFGISFTCNHCLELSTYHLNMRKVHYLMTHSTIHCFSRSVKSFIPLISIQDRVC